MSRSFDNESSEPEGAIQRRKDDNEHGRPHVAIQDGKDDKRQKESSNDTKWEQFNVFEPTQYYTLSDGSGRENEDSDIEQPGTPRRRHANKGSHEGG